MQLQKYYDETSCTQFVIGGTSLSKVLKLYQVLSLSVLIIIIIILLLIVG